MRTEERLFHLAEYGRPRRVQAAINQGADVTDRDRTGWTPLMYAAGWNPNPEVIAILIKAGADINAQTPGGMTPLMCAAKHTDIPEVIITLLRAGADARVQNYKGKTALVYAQGNNALKGTPAIKVLEILTQQGRRSYEKTIQEENKEKPK